MPQLVHTECLGPTAADPAAAEPSRLRPDGEMWAVSGVPTDAPPRLPTRPRSARGERLREGRLGRRAWVLSLALHGGLCVGAVLTVGTRAPRSAPLRSEALAQVVSAEQRLESESAAPPPELMTPSPDMEPAEEVRFEPAPPETQAAEPDLDALPLVDLEPLADPVPAVPTPLTNRELKSRRREPAPPATSAPVPAAPASAPATAPTAPPAPGALHGTQFPDPPFVPALAGVRSRITVHLMLRLEPEGRVVDARVERSSGHLAFDEHARTWVLARWRFAPPGQAVRTRVPVHFLPR